MEFQKIKLTNRNARDLGGEGAESTIILQRKKLLDRLNCFER